MKVPTEGKVMPLTLVLQVMARRGVVVVPSLGSWMEFKINWPKDDISLLDEADLADDLELLLDTGPILSSTVGDEDIVTLEEEDTN